MNEVNINLGEIIKKARLKQGLSQRDLARMMEVTPSLISRWESNKRTPETFDLLRLANLLKIGRFLFVSSEHEEDDIPSSSVMKKLDELTKEIRGLKERLQFQDSAR
jgi:transcriptional regulator with XRE-family HTH domain